MKQIYAKDLLIKNIKKQKKHLYTKSGYFFKIVLANSIKICLKVGQLQLRICVKKFVWCSLLKQRTISYMTRSHRAVINNINDQ